MTRPFPVILLMVSLCGVPFAAAAETGPAFMSSTPPLERLSDVIERPIFAPDRKRHIKLAPVAAPGKPTLTAVILLKDKRYAMLREGDSAARRLTEGETIGGMTIKKIMRDRVVAVSGDGAESILHLFAEPPAETAASAPALPASASIPSPHAALATAGLTAAPSVDMIPAGGVRPSKPLISAQR